MSKFIFFFLLHGELMHLGHLVYLIDIVVMRHIELWHLHKFKKRIDIGLELHRDKSSLILELLNTSLY